MSLNRVCTVCEDVYDVTTVHVCPPMKDWPESQILAAIHDLLAERLPMPNAARPKWVLSSSEDDTEDLICEGCGRHKPCRHCPNTPKTSQNAAQEALGGDSGTQGHQGGSGAHSGDSGDQCPPPDEYVTILRADYDRLLGSQPAEDEVVVKREDVEFTLHAMRAARHETESPYAETRLRAALDGES